MKLIEDYSTKNKRLDVKILLGQDVNRVASAFILLIILSLALVLASETADAPPSVSEIIRIRSDGTVEGTDKIQRNGNVYIVIDDITSSVGTDEAFIFVEKNNIVIDGAGHTIQGTGHGTAIYMLSMRNVTIKNINIKGFETGINFWAVDNWPMDSKYWGLGPASNNRILDNNITTTFTSSPLIPFGWAIDLRYASGTVISGNTITSSSKNGVSLGWDHYYTTIFNNRFIGCGLFLTSSNQTTVLDNTVDGKPLVFLDGASNQVIDDAGQVLLFNCNDITIKNVYPTADLENDIQLSGTSNSEITNCSGHIVLSSSHNNTIHNNYPKTIELRGSNYNQILTSTITDTGVCIKLYGASNYNDIYGNTLSNSSTSAEATSLHYSGENAVGIQLGECQYNNIYWNNIVNHDVGIECYDSSNNNFYANNIAGCGSGISLGGSDQNSIFQNNITDCGCGISIHGASSNNDFYHNNFIDNRLHADESHMTLFSPIINAYSANNTWDAGYPSGGNYWSDYNGTDNNGDGIGDTPYNVYENYTDRYPLMEPLVIPEFPDEENRTTPTTEPFPTTLIAVTIVIVAVAGAVLLVYFRKRHH